MTRQLTTLHEHYHADPRGADSFGKWIEDRIWESLQRPARWVERGPGVPFWIDYGSITPRTVATCIALAVERRAKIPQLQMRVVLLDGTIIREWAAASEATTDRSSNPADLVDG